MRDAPTREYTYTHTQVSTHIHAQTHPHTRARPPTAMLFFCCHKCHTNYFETKKNSPAKHQSHLKTTGRFIKNIRSFYQKQRVVFYRTSATNDTQVVHQRKTQQNTELFLQQCRKFSSSGTQRVAKTLIFHTFGEIRHPLCKRMLQKRAIPLLNNELQ